MSTITRADKGARTGEYALVEEVVSVMRESIAGLEDMDVIHQFAQVRSQADQLTAQGEEVTESLWQMFDVLEDEILKRMRR